MTQSHTHNKYKCNQPNTSRYYRRVKPSLQTESKATGSVEKVSYQGLAMVVGIPKLGIKDQIVMKRERKGLQKRKNQDTKTTHRQGEGSVYTDTQIESNVIPRKSLQKYNYCSRTDKQMSLLTPKGRI